MANYGKCMVIFLKISNSYHGIIPSHNLKTFPTLCNTGKKTDCHIYLYSQESRN